MLDFILEIHSSSLSIAPQGTPSQSTAHSTTNTVSDEESNERGRVLKSNLNTPLSTYHEFQESAKKQQAQQLRLISENDSNHLLNARTINALNTYTSTFNQLLQQNAASNLTGIDLYV
ncbi:MAG: hypothetical protein DRQ62_13945 [Gammaproteobacteria bacterium]|nr:MAG: hypothetical protein DRQ62_13945 [Gammaproteobacteria bacterium]